ncbi:MAG: hypothetical protein HQM10_17055 [Candidatus Riflebacteria bacterium]|nr:hypothetical protein [Candidatus Riflebacteria bacterium]
MMSRKNRFAFLLKICLGFTMFLLSAYCSSIQASTESKEPVFSQEPSDLKAPPANPEHVTEVKPAQEPPSKSEKKSESSKEILKSELKETADKIKDAPVKKEKERSTIKSKKSKKSSKKSSKSKARAKQKKSRKSKAITVPVKIQPFETGTEIVLHSETRIPCFSSALEKMQKMRTRRLKEAQRLGILLPSQGGSIENVSGPLFRLNQALNSMILQQNPPAVNDLPVTPSNL